MKRLIYLTGLYFCALLSAHDEGQSKDEPLSKESWSQFGPLSKQYVLGRKGKPDAAYKILKSYVKPEMAILDLGCGTGISTRQLCSHGFINVMGADRDPLMLKEAMATNPEELPLKYVQADISVGLPFSNGQFDVVTASSAFHWFSNSSSIQEVARILKPQGYYFILGGGKSRTEIKKENPVDEKIKAMLKDVGAVEPTEKYSVIADLLEAEGFNIIVDTAVPTENNYTKDEYLNLIQSRSIWNKVPEGERPALIEKIDQYLETVLNENGFIKIEGNVTVVLGQKR